MRIGVVRFPGSCDERDALLAAARVGEAELLWHADPDIKGVDAVVVPGGFSYGDYLRGICNGFQVLCEAGLLPGALLPNTSLRFICRQVEVEVVNPDTAFTRACARGDRLSIPIKHTTGRFFSPEPVDPDQIVLRYAPGQNPNGSQDDIAGVCNPEGNVLGLMPHPEHAVDPLTGSADGLKLFESLSVERAVAA
jgi:phosphoribosylformylglycinamidine synthase